LLTALLAALFAAACTAPRSILHSPQALPKGGFEAGLQIDGNIPTQTLSALYGGLGDGIDAMADKASGSAVPADSLNGLVKALIAYSADPVGTQPGAYVRYGFLPRWDGGYHRNGGANALDVRWQFLGPIAGDSASHPGAWSGSLGAQYSSQSFELPSTLGLDKLQDLIGYEFSRTDLLFPLVFGRPFGAMGRFGGFGVGAAYNLTFIEYDARIQKLLERLADGSARPFAPLHGERTVSAYGAFANARIGYRWIYLVGSFACYWQDYGSFPVFGGESVALSGLTFLPAAALELRW
jgi:hypothetical protein